MTGRRPADRRATDQWSTGRLPADGWSVDPPMDPPGDEETVDDDSSRSPVELLRPDRIDPFLGDRELRAAYRVMVDGDWTRLERFLQVSAKGWLFSSIVTGEIVAMETIVFERWVDFRQSAQSRVMLANALIRDAFAEYEVRRDIGFSGLAGAGGPGAGRPGMTDRSPFEDPPDPTIDGLADEADDRFVTKLSAAEELLYEVISERPAMAEPWVGLLTSGRGLQVDLDELRERFENAHSRDPFRPDACRQYLQGLTKKWGGSNVASFDLARWVQVEAPPAAPAREALPMAHIERGLYQYGTEKLSRYLTQPEVVTELQNGLIDYLQATSSSGPSLSVPAQSPAAPQSLGVLNAYALALHVGDRNTAGLMNETLARIDNRPTEWPWIVFADDVAAVFAEVQADQLRAASRY